MAWLGKIETDSILIREMRKHLSKMFDRVSKMFEEQALLKIEEKGFIEVYIDNRSVFVIVYFIFFITHDWAQ
jgi:hypothetical protein